MIAVIMFVGIAMMTFIKPFLRIYVSKEYFIAWKRCCSDSIVFPY